MKHPNPRVDVDPDDGFGPRLKIGGRPIPLPWEEPTNGPRPDSPDFPDDPWPSPTDDPFGFELIGIAKSEGGGGEEEPPDDDLYLLVWRLWRLRMTEKYGWPPPPPGFDPRPDSPFDDEEGGGAVAPWFLSDVEIPPGDPPPSNDLLGQAARRFPELRRQLEGLQHTIGYGSHWKPWLPDGGGFGVELGQELLKGGLDAVSPLIDPWLSPALGAIRGVAESVGFSPRSQ